jgi:hypothetical protein
MLPRTPLHALLARQTTLRGARFSCFALLLVGGPLLAAACARQPRVEAPGAVAEQQEPEENDSAVPLPEFVFVSVENHNWNDVVVSLVNSGGQRLRLGTVTAGATTTLRFPGSYIAGAQRLQLSAKAVGGRATVLSEGCAVGAGQQVTWTLESSLQRSSLSVR